MSCRNFNVYSGERSRYGTVTIVKEPRKTSVVLHSTPVVVKTAKTITLNFEGWVTWSTQTTINTALRQFGAGAWVQRKKGQFLIDGKVIKSGHRIKLEKGHDNG